MSDSSPRLCTGFEMKTEPVPVELPEAVIAAAATVKATTPMATANALMRMLRRR